MSQLSGMGQLIAEAIVDGELDGDLNKIADAINFRRSSLSAVKRFEWKVGDRVQFNEHVKPRYMEGEFATVVRFKSKKVVVQLDRPSGRFLGTEVTCPPEILDRVSSAEVVRKQVDAIIDKYGEGSVKPEIDWTK